MKKYILFLILVCLTSMVFGQGLYPINGPAQNQPDLHVFINATIYLNATTKLEKASLLIENGRIKAVGKSIKIPSGAFVHDLNGQTIYPAFIDLYSDYGLEPAKPLIRPPSQDKSETAQKGAYYWNQAIKPQINASESFVGDATSAALYRGQGFGALVSQHFDGIVRGTATLTSLNTRAPARKAIIKANAAMAFSFSKGSSSQDYPFALTGSIALIRQFFLDAQYYQTASKLPNPPAPNFSLEAYNNQAALPIVFDAAGSPETLLRAARISKEFNKNMLIRGSGAEYQQIQQIAGSGLKLIIPLDFPDAYQADNPATTHLIGYTQMLHWQHAPTNPARLAAAGIDFSFTLHGLKDKNLFWPRLRQAIAQGLPPERALAALTSIPASFIGAQNQIGSLRAGLRANFIICSADIFQDSAKILANWTDGEYYPIEKPVAKLPKGKYNITIAGYPNLVFQHCGAAAASLKLAQDTNALPHQFGFDNNKQFRLNFAMNAKKTSRLISLVGKLENNMLLGNGYDSLGQPLVWQAAYEAFVCPVAPIKPVIKPGKTVLVALPEPFSPYGFLPENRPKAAQNLVIRGASIWTCGPLGKLDTADVWVVGSTIRAVGKNLIVPASATVISGYGLHLTPGIIDEHSHIALTGGVNEGSQSVTSEVRMGDVINAADINIYRHLAGGVTAAQLLHGSANSVGGQSALIKMRWGRSADELKIKNAPGFIKFALGENVKQSNWGNTNKIRYPQTRMGVEQTLMDAFLRAKEYQNEWAIYNKNPNASTRPRTDLELEALAEILESKRFISCHSYVQSEINMLMHLADSLNFKINTFTHILEGYKLSDKMQSHGAGGATFADWWAYKMEVLDAIPYNAAMMSKAGVLVAINSDNAEMARRLNQEAAKTIKYGGLSPEQALNLITINPAKLLHLDKQIGSIEVGKDADLVLWSSAPLSVYARPLKTWIEGVCLFDLKSDSIQAAYIASSRQTLIGHMIEAQKAGLPTRPPASAPAVLWHCEDTEYRYQGWE